MKKIFVRLIRLVFLALMLMPAVVLLSHVLLGDLARGVYGFGCAMFAGMLVTFLPAYVGNYRDGNRCGSRIPPP